MNIEKLFLNIKYLDKEIDFFKKKKHIKKINPNSDLVSSHINKAKHRTNVFIIS